VEESSVPLVSVLIPTHNRPGWLAGSLRSVLDGEFKDFELIVSNNGDPEHTRRLAEEIEDPRIRWVEHDPTSSALEHMASLFCRATGRYVAVLHDDDWWDSTFLAKLVPPLEERDDAVLAFCDLHHVDTDDVLHPRTAEQLSVRFGRADRAEGYHQPFFDVAARQSAPWTGSVIRREVLRFDEVPTEMVTVDDVWIVYALARTGGAAYFRKERLLYRRAHAGSTTSGRFLETYTGAIALREHMMQDPGMAPYRAELEDQLSRDHLSAGGALLRDRARRRARRHLLRSIRLRPRAKAFGGLVASFAVPDALLDRI
jgi:glycosyltransferase involved in cell wall biosynthesis